MGKFVQPLQIVKSGILAVPTDMRGPEIDGIDGH